MAVKVTGWHGNAGDKDWNNSGNWNNGVPATITDADTVIWLANATFDCELNIAQTADIKLSRIIFEDGCTKNLGLNAGSPFTRSVSEIIHQGSGTLYFKDGDSLTNRILIDAPNDTLAANIDGNTVTSLDIMRGKVNVAATMGIITRLVMGFRNDAINDVDLTVSSGAGNISEFIQHGGVSNISGAVTNALVLGGICNYLEGALITLRLAGGRFNFESNDALQLAHVVAGLFDCNTSGIAKTITEIIVHRDAILNKSTHTTIGAEIVLPGGIVTFNKIAA